MIKSIFLNQKSKARKNQQAHCTYQESSSIGILYNAEEFSDAIIDELIDGFEADLKTVGKLGYIDKAPDPESVQNFIFTRKDISGTGGIKKDSISFFTNQSFDFLVSLNTSQNINYKFILATSKAVCKVGLETDWYQELLLMSIKPEDQKVASVKSLVKYLKMI